MRISYVVHKYPPESLGGTEIHTWTLARCLARLGHRVDVFYPLLGLGRDSARVVRDGVNLWRAPMTEQRETENPLKQFWHTFRDTAIERDFARFLKAVDPNVVHFQHVQGVSARLIAQAKRKPRVLTLHDYWYFCANSQLITPERKLCESRLVGRQCVDCATARLDLKWLRPARPLVAIPFSLRNRYLRGLLREIDVLISPSKFLRHEYAARGFPAGRIRILENGIDSARLLTTAGLELPPVPQRPHFVFLGSLAWQKGVHILVHAFNQLADACSLTIYGSGHAFPDYAREIRSMVRHPHIRLAGPVDHERIGDALHQADCLVVPSLWYENSPMVIQEAFAAGVPVVASRLGAMIEKVSEGKTGRLFGAGETADLARVLADIVEHPEQLSYLKKNVRPGPSIEAQADELLAIYEDLLTGNGMRRNEPSGPAHRQ